MEPLDPLAVYGAGLATATAGWTIVNEIRSRKPRVRVSGTLSLVVSTADQFKTLATAAKAGGEINAPWSIEVAVVNMGRADAEISEVFVLQRAEGAARTWRAANADLPRTLKTDQGMRVVIEGFESGPDTSQPLFAVATTASGRRFESESFGTRKDTVLAVRRSVLEASLGHPVEDLPGAFVYEVNVGDAGDGAER